MGELLTLGGMVWASTDLCQFLLFLGVLNVILKISSLLGCIGMVVLISVPKGIKNVS